MSTANIYNVKKTGAFSGKEKSMIGLPKRIFAFYRDGFRSMVVGRTLWKIIAFKLFILFAVLKLFFFPNFLKTNFESDAERATHVLNSLTGTRSNR